MALVIPFGIIWAQHKCIIQSRTAETLV